MLIVPSQSAGIRTFIKLLRGGNSPSVKGVVVPAVLELFPNTSADLEIEIGCYGHIAGLVFAFAIVPRNYRRYDAVNNLGPALERPLISLSGTSAKSATPLGVRDSWAPCTHHPWQKLPYTVTRFCLLPLEGKPLKTEPWRRRSAAHLTTQTATLSAAGRGAYRQ